MSQSKQNEETVLAYLRGYRAQRAAEAEARDYSRLTPPEDKPLGISPKCLAMALKLTYGKVAGALKRLEKQGLVEEVTEGRGHRSAGWACREEVERADASHRETRIVDLTNRHGSASGFAEKVTRDILRVQAVLEQLKVKLVQAGDDVLAIERVRDATPAHNGYSTRRLLKVDDEDDDFDA